MLDARTKEQQEEILIPQVPNPVKPQLQTDIYTEAVFR
jgi:hypothetical protein